MIDFEPKIYNAKIKYSYLGLDNDNNLYLELGFDCANNKFYKTNKIYIHESDILKKLIQVLDLHSWEEMARKFARIKIDNTGISEIGNLIDERWVEL